MKINAIAPQGLYYSQKNNINFGKFADDNAREVVRKALHTEDPAMKPVYDSWFKRIEDDENFIAYTDEESGKVKGRFDDEFVKNNSDTSVYSQRAITNTIARLKKRGNLDDLSVFKNLNAIVIRISDFPDLLKGVNLTDKLRSDGSAESEILEAAEAWDEARKNGFYF